MFEPNYLQQQYINTIETAFENGIKNKDGSYLSTIMSCLNKMQPAGSLPDLFYEFWFDKMLTDNSQTFINFLNPKFDSIWKIDVKQKALYVERYLKILNDNNQNEQVKNLLDKALSFGLIIEPIFIASLETDRTFFTETNKRMSEKIAEKNIKKFFETATPNKNYK